MSFSDSFYPFYSILFVLSNYVLFQAIIKFVIIYTMMQIIIERQLIHMLGITCLPLNGCLYILSGTSDSRANTCIGLPLASADSKKGIYINNQVHLLVLRWSFVLQTDKRINNFLRHPRIILDMSNPILHFILSLPLFF